jgi:hypothetical protein
MTDEKIRNVCFRRLRAVLALRETTLLETAKRVGCTPSHLRFVLIGARLPSAALRSKLERELRAADWAFARGQVDMLCDEDRGVA